MFCLCILVLGGVDFVLIVKEFFFGFVGKILKFFECVKMWILDKNDKFKNYV